MVTISHGVPWIVCQHSKVSSPVADQSLAGLGYHDSKGNRRG